MKRLSKYEIKVQDVLNVNTLKRGALSLTVATAFSLASCSDSKSCSDSDVTQYADGNGSTAYDTGTYADSYDFGGDTDTTVHGDDAGNGDECADFD